MQKKSLAKLAYFPVSGLATAGAISPDPATAICGMLIFFVMSNLAINGTIILFFQKFLLKDNFKKIPSREIMLAILGITFFNIIADIFGFMTIANSLITSVAITAILVFAFSFLVLKNYIKLPAKDSIILAVLLVALTNPGWIGTLSADFLLSLSESWGLVAAITIVVIAFPLLLKETAKGRDEEEQKEIFKMLAIWGWLFTLGVLLIAIAFYLGVTNTALVTI